MRLGPKGYLGLLDTFRVVSSASGVNCGYLQPCLLTLTILDTRQWDSMWNKSLAHKYKPLVQKEMWDTEISWPLITSKQKLSVPMANADLLVNLWMLLFEDTQVYSQFIFPSMNWSCGYVLFQLGWKLLARFNISLLFLFMLCLVPW